MRIETMTGYLMTSLDALKHGLHVLKAVLPSDVEGIDDPSPDLHPQFSGPPLRPTPELDAAFARLHGTAGPPRAEGVPTGGIVGPGHITGSQQRAGASPGYGSTAFPHGKTLPNQSVSFYRDAEVAVQQLDQGLSLGTSYQRSGKQWRSNWSDSDPGHLSAEDAAELQRHASQLRDKLRDAHARMRVQEAELESKDKEIARLKKQLSERAEDKP